MPYLSRDVRDRRYADLRTALRAANLDALLVSDPDYFFFFTNYTLDVRTWERPILLVLPAEGQPWAVMHQMSRNGVALAAEQGRMWVDDITYYAEHPQVADRLPLRLQFAATVADRLRSCDLADARVGYDITPADEAPLRTLLPTLEMRDADQLLRPLRWVKTAEELDLVRRAGELSDFGQERFRKGLAVGRFVQELDQAVITEVTAEACRRFAGEDFSMRLHSWCGPESAAPHGGPRTGATFVEGDGVVDILTIRLNGLEVENERTWFVGRPNEEQVRCFEATTEAVTAASAKLVAGNRVCDVDAAAQEVYERAGLARHILHRTGHGMGIVRHEYPEDMAFCTRPLYPAEQYSCEPGIYVQGLGGFRHDDTVIVGEAEPEVVTHAPKDLHHQTVLGA